MYDNFGDYLYYFSVLFEPLQDCYLFNSFEKIKLLDEENQIVEMEYPVFRENAGYKLTGLNRKILD